MIILKQPERVDLAGGKYTIVNVNGILSAFRNGEPWDADLLGNNLCYWMFVRIKELETELDAMKK